MGHTCSQGYDDGERWRRTAEQLFRTMVAEGVVPNTTTYNALLAVHAAARSTEGAEAAKMTLEALEAHPTLQPDRVSYETAISAFAIPDWCAAASSSSCSKSAVSGSLRR
jgi:hypothetical protein